MKIFKATPIESRLNDARWESGSHKGWIVVRAESKDRAISIASRDLVIATTRRIGADVRLPPWSNNELVSWTEINDPKYTPEGEEDVIDRG